MAIFTITAVGFGFFTLASNLNESNETPEYLTYGQDSFMLRADFTPVSYPFGVGGPNIEDNALVPAQLFFDVTEFSDKEVEINSFDKSTLTIGRKVAHLVLPGETLSIIAEKYGISAETIRFNNPSLAEKKYLHAGDELIIPWEDGIFYKVVKGDTLSEIARKYDISVESIKNNNLEIEPLSLGQEIFLPGAKPKTNLVTTAKRAILNNQSSSVTDNETSIGGIPGFKSWTSGQDIGLGLIAPVTGIITQGYGNTAFARRSGFYSRSNNQHRGVDIGAERGTPIYAAAAGEVTFSGWMNGYGNVVFIKHDNGFETRYGHNTKNLVKKGDMVSAGEQIATLGSTGRSTGPHLHFEVRNAKGSDNMDFYRSYLEN